MDLCEVLGPLCAHELGDELALVTTFACADVVFRALPNAGATIIDGAEFSKTIEAIASGWRKDGRTGTILAVTNEEFVHLEPAAISNIKLAAIAAGSSFDLSAVIARTLELTRDTDYLGQRRLEVAILDAIESASELAFVAHGRRCAFRHQEVDNWFSLNGPLAFGDQTVLPTGEMSALSSPSGTWSSERRLPLDGWLCLEGFPLVHRGDDRVDIADCKALFDRLTASRAGCFARVDDGRITALEPRDSGGRTCSTLEELFCDDRYRIVHEVGFGTNALCISPQGDNSVCDERTMGVHFGLGLGGETRFHIDIVCPATRVVAVADGVEQVIL